MYDLIFQEVQRRTIKMLQIVSDLIVIFIAPQKSSEVTWRFFFRLFVSNAAMDDSNIILTSEEFTKPELNITELMSYLVPQYNIHNVLYYHRFYDWIYSLYNQLSKMGNIKEPITLVDWLLQDTTFQRYDPLSPAAVYN